MQAPMPSHAFPCKISYNSFSNHSGKPALALHYLRMSLAQWSFSRHYHLAVMRLLQAARNSNT